MAHEALFGHGKTDPRTAQLQLQTKQCPVCCGDVFWEVKRKMEMPCCFLHNICEEHGDNFALEVTDRPVNIQPHGQALPEHGNLEGSNIRAALMAYFNRGDE